MLVNFHQQAVWVYNFSQQSFRISPDYGDIVETIWEDQHSWEQQVSKCFIEPAVTRTWFKLYEFGCVHTVLCLVA